MKKQPDTTLHPDRLEKAKELICLLTAISRVSKRLAGEIDQLERHFAAEGGEAGG